MENEKIITLLKSGAAVKVKVKGKSMMPFLSEKDFVIAQKNDKKLEIGDIAFYVNNAGILVMHRLVRTEDELCYFKGDACIHPDIPVTGDAVLAQVTSFIHNGKKHSADSLKNIFFKKFWNTTPLYKLYAYNEKSGD